MTVLINIKEKLKPYFTLKTEKEETWLDYLCEETAYVNGGVYFHSETPKYHKQKVNSDSFNMTETKLEWNLFMKFENVVSNQFKKATVSINNTELFNTPFTINEGFLVVQLPRNLSGALSISIPSLNERLNHYQGFIYNREIRSQELHLKSGSDFVNDTTNNKLTFTIELTNPCKNQLLECVTYYANGNLNDKRKKTIYLSGSDTIITVNMDRGSQDVGVKLNLKPITFNNVSYIGNEVKIGFP